MALSNFYSGTTVEFNATIEVTPAGGSATNPDITGDTVTITFRRKDKNRAATAITGTGDVSGGSNGVVSFELSGTDTDVPEGSYEYQIKWVSGTYGTHIFAGSLDILENFT